MLSKLFAANTIRLARVTRVWPEGQALDCIFLDTGDYGRGVQVMSPYAGSDFGFSGVPAPEKEGDAPNMTNNGDQRTILAVVACLSGISICLGYLHPAGGEMTFAKDQHKNRLIERHTSDFYRTINDDGDLDMVHPSGAFLRLGSGSTPDVLDRKDFRKKWQLKHNKTKKPAMTLHTSGSDLSLSETGLVAKGKEATLTMDSSGLAAAAPNKATLSGGGAKVEMTAGQAKMTAPAVSVDAAMTTMTGQATVTGLLTAMDDILF